MKKYIELFKEFKKKRYAKAVFFFGFYLLLFLIIGILTRVNDPNNKYEFERGDSGVLDVRSIRNNNYSFTYEVKLDDDTYNYEGNKSDDKINYKYNEKEYYQDKLKTYVKKDDWSSTDSPIKFYKLLDENTLRNIVDSSYVESKTTYDNGNTVYNLLVSSNTLNEILDDKDTDIEEIPNKIVISMNSNNYITEIDYDLGSYCKEKNVCKDKLNIACKYTDFSNVNY